jgi:hypothetical protein
LPNLWDRPLFTPDEFDELLKQGLEKVQATKENMPLSADEFAEELRSVIAHASPISVALDCEDKRAWLALPASAEQLNKALLDIGALDSPYSIGDCKVSPDLPLHSYIVGGAVNEANYLAARLSELPQAEWDKLAAVLETPALLPGMAQLIDYTYNTDYFVFTPGIHSAEDLGRHELYQSQQIEMPGEWKSAIDPVRLGQRIAELEGGLFTPHGYLSQSGDKWNEVYERTGVIPPENYLKNAEMSTEQNYNQIDGLMNNTAQPKADLTDGQTHEEIQELAPETQRSDALRKADKPSILAALVAAKEEAAAAGTPAPTQERTPKDRDL